MTPTEQIVEQCLKLQDLLLTNHPTMPILLRQIHTQLKADPEIVTLLSEDDVSIVVRGLKKQTQTEVAMAAIKSKTKSVKSMTVADL